MIITGEQNDNQRTEAWFKSRMGRFSCSQLHRLMTEPKSKTESLSDGAKTYIMECIAEKLTGKSAKEDFTSKYTDWGILHEPIAVGIYEEVFGVKTEAVGYIAHGENFGGSPDRLVGKDGGIEIKCPFTITAHIVHSITQDLKKDYKECYWQIIGYLIATNRPWWDFISYHPEYPAKYQFKRIRLEREDVKADITQAELKINQSTEYLNLILNSI